MKNIIRFVGTFGAVVGTLDLYQLLRFAPRMFGAGAALHTPNYVLYPLLIVNGTFCVLLVWFSVLVWFRPMAAIRRLSSLFLGEILYFLLQLLLSEVTIMPARVANAFGSSFGVAGVGMYLQFFSGLPLWGSILALYVLRKERSAQPSS